MSQQYRLVIHCDENRTPDCAGLIEYLSADRIDLARKSDGHLQSGWLKGFSKGGSYDVCPACRRLVERERGEA